ncbi:unnamed protein product [marine sediment metagenome]|uniref:Uncharacterized protein n=1 Tax=marine sediment metagenome TaxID=412755 RepID=X1BVR8_9ZZZZ
MGLIIYLILRPPEFIDDVIERDLEIERMQILLNNKQSNCPACGGLAKDDFSIVKSSFKSSSIFLLLGEAEAKIIFFL